MVNEKKEKILVTGCAGFIGMNLSKKMLEQKYNVLGIDNLNDYYSVELKKERLKVLKKYNSFDYLNVDLINKKLLEEIFEKNSIDKVVNLAAQAGVRYSLENPNSYVESNVLGFMNILECCRNYGIKGLIYASSSSVYGGNTLVPFSETHDIVNPTSIYAATKISNELMARSYYNLFGLKSTGLRFFTVYGPWGRPDMAYYIFTKKIFENKKIKVFNFGNNSRDFTYIDDIVQGITSAIKNNYNCEVFNLGNNDTIKVTKMIKIIEEKLNLRAKIKLKPMQMGDIKKTYADITKAKRMLDYKPITKLKSGMEEFINWFCSYSNL